MSWIIQLREPEHELGERYYSSYGNNVVNTKEEAKIFSYRQDADKKAKECTAWGNAKAVHLVADIRIPTKFLKEIASDIESGKNIKNWKYVSAGGNVLVCERVIHKYDSLDFTYNPED